MTHEVPFDSIGKPGNTYTGPVHPEMGPGAVDGLRIPKMVPGSAETHANATVLAESKLMGADGRQASLMGLVRAGDTMCAVTAIHRRGQEPDEMVVVALPFGHETPEEGERTGRVLARVSTANGAMSKILFGRGGEDVLPVSPNNPDSLMSGKHFSLQLDAKGFIVRDGEYGQGSAKGTSVVTARLDAAFRSKEMLGLVARLQKEPWLWDGQFSDKMVQRVL